MTAAQRVDRRALDALAAALRRLSLTPTEVGNAMAGGPGETRSERQSRCRAGSRVLDAKNEPGLDALARLARAEGLEVRITPEGQIRVRRA